MTDDRELSLVLEAWLRDGPVRMPDRVSDVVGVRIARQAQRRGWRTVRGRQVRIDPVLAAAAVVALLVVTLVAVAVIGRAPSVVTPRLAPAVGPGTGPGLIVVETTNLTKHNELRYVAPDRRLLPLLPDFGGHQRTAAWRPDGLRLAFAGWPHGQADPWMHLYETDATGSTPRMLSTDCDPPACVEETDPAYSADGQRLVAVRLADLRAGTPTRSVLVIYDLASGRAREVPNTSYPYDTRDIGHPRWSPDGRRIVFHVVHDPPTERRRLIYPEPTSPGPSAIFLVATDGSGLHQLTPDGMDAGDPDWAPNGSIVFGPTPLHLWLYGLDQSDWAIRTINPDGSRLRVVVPPGDAATPSWTGGGDRILLIGTSAINSRAAIQVVGADGSGLADVATFAGDVAIYPVQQPTP